jgi:hypothetical protein
MGQNDWSRGKPGEWDLRSQEENMVKEGVIKYVKIK